MHSTASDGVLAPRQILERAKGEGLSAIAVTDHDTLAGARVACDLADSFGVRVVPGVELSTQTDGRDVHLLGYFVDLSSPALDAFFSENRARREARACAIADRLAEDGYRVSSAAMRATGATLNRSLLARLLVEEGHARNIDDAFDRLIGSKSPYYVDSSYPETVEVIELVREAGGFAFVAHPAHYGVVDLIECFAAAGMAGLEAYHTLHTPQQSAALVQLADQLGLAVSGGSDWHGDASHGARLGGAGLTDAQFAAFCRACGQTDF